MIELFTAKSGAPSIKVNGVAIHSPYDPLREADRFVQETIGEERPSTVIVLGESVGHLVDAVTRAKPDAILLAAVYSSDIARASPLRGVPAWNPAAPLAFSDFLRLHLGELQIEGLRVVEWPPAARAFPDVSKAINESVRRVVQELNGSFVTTVSAGRTWLRNTLANFLYAHRVLSGSLCATNRPVVIAAPGPSLKEAGPLLSEVRAHVDLWALPSSCPFLLDSEIFPDLVVMTDPGFYSMHHLHFAPPSCPLAFPLSAARGSWALSYGQGDRGTAVFFLGQPVLFERAFLDAARINAPLIPPHGTVAATAIDLALASTGAPVIVAGLDMGARDLLSHALPNAFDLLLHLQASRLQPHASLAFQRAAAQGSAIDYRGAGLRTSAALRTYAGWFDEGLPDTRGRLHRLMPSAVPLARMAPLDGPGFSNLIRNLGQSRGGTGLRTHPGFPGGDERKRLASRLLKEWGAQISAARDSRTDDGRTPLILELAHVIAPRLLVDSMKKARQGDSAGARASAGEMFTECLAFLDKLEEKTLG